MNLDRSIEDAKTITIITAAAKTLVSSNSNSKKVWPHGILLSTALLYIWFDFRFDWHGAWHMYVFIDSWIMNLIAFANYEFDVNVVTAVVAQNILSLTINLIILCLWLHIHFVFSMPILFIGCSFNVLNVSLISHHHQWHQRSTACCCQCSVKNQICKFRVIPWEWERDQIAKLCEAIAISQNEMSQTHNELESNFLTLHLYALVLA